MTSRGRLDFLIRRLRRVAEQTADGATDASLLERFVAGRDEAAFELLLWRHGPMVLGVCRRMLRCDQDAEDAFQATFLLLSRKAASVRRREAVAAWLYRTAYRIALRARQTARLRPVAIPLGMEPAAAASEPDVLWRDLRPVLDDEIHRLPAKYRLPMVLCYFEGRTHAEAALELGCPKGTLSVRLQRARELLRGRLTRRGLALSAASLAVLTAGRIASAAVPAALIHGTLKAALLFAAGKAVAGAASVRAVAWTHGVLKTMVLSKLKLLAAVILTAATATGAGFFLSRTAAAPPRPKADPPVVKQVEDAKAAAEAPAGPERPLVKASAEMSTEREGRLALVGTEIKAGEAVPAADRVKVETGFLAVEIGDKSDSNAGVGVPKGQWVQVKDYPSKIYVRWKAGDALPAGKLAVAREEREYRKLRVGDAVEKGQLLAIVDEAPALDALSDSADALEVAEADYRAAIKTKEEAIRRASSAENLYQKGKGYISEDDYRAAQLTRDRYVEEEKAKVAAVHHAEHKVPTALADLEASEVRSSDTGVVKAILKRRGEAVHSLEPIVRLEVLEAAGPEAPKPAPVVNVPSQRDGVLLVVGTEIKDGAKVPKDRLLTVKRDGRATTYRRLREGDAVEEGQLLARVDDRLARIDLDVAKSKLEGAMADMNAAGRSKEEAARRYQLDLKSPAAVPEVTLSTDKLNAERYAEEEKSKAAGVRVAEEQVMAAQAVLEMYEIRSPVRGTVKAILKSRGEAVKSLETVVRIQPKD